MYTLTDADLPVDQQPVIYDATGSSIPPDPANRHFQEYLAWLAEGNTPNPAPPPRERSLTYEHFRAEFTAPEWEGIITAATGKQTAPVLDYLLRCAGAGHVDMNAVWVTDGLQMLVTMGLLAPHRVDEIIEGTGPDAYPNPA